VGMGRIYQLLVRSKRALMKFKVIESEARGWGKDEETWLSLGTDDGRGLMEGGGHRESHAEGKQCILPGSLSLGICVDGQVNTWVEEHKCHENDLFWGKMSVIITMLEIVSVTRMLTGPKRGCSYGGPVSEDGTRRNASFSCSGAQLHLLLHLRSQFAPCLSNRTASFPFSY
jgi:hypothetical protein